VAARWDAADAGCRRYPLIAPEAIPAAICRLKNRNISGGGMVIRGMFMKCRLY
jgi:hypothetical protein